MIPLSGIFPHQIPLSGIFPHHFAQISHFISAVSKARSTNLMVLKRPFGLKELFKSMSVWLASLLFEMRTFAKETP